ncbi:MAG: outer membrane lipoprotein carrier protein LolA [Bacteroidales bacterium]|nr:outer membrane lipoprotein carrier protein LolA [Bacteroidales bacterium]
MSQIRKSVLGTLFVFTSFTLLNAQQDPKAESYLQAVSEQFKLDEGYRIEMDYIREDIMRETYAEGEGIIWMRGLKYKIIVDEFIVYFDGTKLYSQNTEVEEVYVSIPDPDQPNYLQAVPIKIIKAYQQDFKYQYIGTKSFMGKDRAEIQLYPKDLTGPYSMLIMFVNPHSLKLEGIQLKHKEGIHYTMILSKVEGKQTLGDDTFVFDPDAYPNTEVIELLD